MKLHPNWSQEDRHNAKMFFASPTGERIIQTLIANRPTIDGETTKKAGVSGLKAQAWENCVNMIALILETDFETPSTDGLEQIDVTKFSSRPVPNG